MSRTHNTRIISTTADALIEPFNDPWLMILAPSKNWVNSVQYTHKTDTRLLRPSGFTRLIRV